MSSIFLQAGPLVSEAALKDLHHRTVGVLTAPGDAGWETARLPWHRGVDQLPIAVLQIRDRDDVVESVRWAVANGVRVMAQPYGHGAGADLRGVLLLRTAALDEIDIDVTHHRVRVGAGVTAGALANALAGTGLTFLTGSAPGPSVVGMTISGGISWFGRAFGLGCDSIIGAELVDGLGRVRRVSSTQEPGLLWCLRGGGGAFGIITSLDLALHPAPRIHGVRLAWPLERMAQVLTAFTQVCEMAPDALTTWLHVLRFPDLPGVPEALRGKALTSVTALHLGTKEEAEELLAPLLAVPGLAPVESHEIGFGEVPDFNGEPTDPLPAVTASTLLERLDGPTMERLVATVGSGTDCPLAIVQLRHLGGALGRTAPDGGCHGPVREPYLLHVIGVSSGTGAGAVLLRSCEAALAAVGGASSGRTLMNFMAADQEDTWWSESTKARLLDLKQRTDPVDTIRSNRPVRC